MRLTWSIIICSIDAGKFAQVSQCYQHLLADRQFEIIGIHDASSLSEGYNRGIERAQGDIVVFSHDDILIIDADFANKVEQRLSIDAFHLLGFAGTTRLDDGYWWASGAAHMRGVVAHAPPANPQLSLCVYGVTGHTTNIVQALDGLCIIASRATVDKLRFDAAVFDGFHLYDLDYSWSAHLLGLRVGVMTDIAIIHYSAGQFGSDWRHYRQQFLIKHAATLGVDLSAPFPQLKKMRCQTALFQDVNTLLAVWQPAYLQRATIALQRRLAA